MMLYSHGECKVNSNNSIEFPTASHTPVTKPVLDEILLDQDSHLLSPLGMFWLLPDCCYKPGPGSTCHQSQPAANTRHNYCLHLQLQLLQLLQLIYLQLQLLNTLHKLTCGSTRLQKTMKLWCLVSCDHCRSLK